jgi:quercetin dioxygenase-like cupin family protein
MERDQFAALLRQEGFEQLVTVEREPKGALALHRHPFQAEALILDGELRLVQDGREQVCRRGDLFHLAPNAPHAESDGPEGLRCLAGRKPV